MARLAKDKSPTRPVESTYHIYPVLEIPTEKEGEKLIIGQRKARAVVKWIDEIRAFLDRHPHGQG
ncbi:MAG TPA: hypothetical protein DCG53_11875 [Syntrophus sp. (in: bacteria)]|nr:hypothetical protein [Syntrophus sp. (in: bacteria)]